MLPLRAAPPCLAASTADRPLARVLRSMLDRHVSEAGRLGATLEVWIDVSGASRAVPFARGEHLLSDRLRPLLSQVFVASTAGV